ncbi:MAG: DoxX family membrane protein, partial [Nanoarchaeota archaeon]
SQLIHPEDFRGYLPEWLLALDVARSIVLINGLSEILLGGLLLIGFLIRPVALLLCVHLLTIIVSLGYNDIAVRDVGLMLVTISIFLGGADKWSLDYRRNKA